MAGVPAPIRVKGIDLHDDRAKQAAMEDRREAALLRAKALRDNLPELTGFEDPATRDLIMAQRAMRQAGMVTLKPILPLLLRLKGKPYKLHNYFPFEPFFRTRMPKTVLLKTGRQVSKTVANTSQARVYAANGRPVRGRDIKIGDRVLCVDERRRSVSGVVTDKITNPGKPVVRVTTRTGVVLDVAESHPLQKVTGWTKAADIRVGDRVAALRVGGAFGVRVEDRARIVLTAYLLGDGCTRGNLEVSGIGAEVRAECQELGQKFQSFKVRSTPTAVHFSRAACSQLVRWLHADSLLDKYAWEKSIPPWVYDLSETDTALFVSRLWATDGMIKTNTTGKPTITYTSTSRRLAYDLKALLTKFGVPTSVAKRKAGYRKKCGTYKRCRDAYVLRVETRAGWSKFFATFSVPDKPPVPIPDVAENNNRDTVPIDVSGWIAELAGECRGTDGPALSHAGLRKKPKYALTYGKLRDYVAFFREHNPKHRRLRDLEDLAAGDVLWDEVVAVRKLGVRACWDIEVETHHNYVLDGVMSHNSTSLAAQGVVFSNSIPYFSTLYVTPLFEMIRRFSHNYVRQFIEESPARKLFSGSKTINSVLQRTFLNGSAMYFSYAFLDAERTRGIPADKNVIDEVQDMNYDFLQIIHETLSGSPYGLRQYAGTPKSLDNTIEKLWQDSSQAEWMIRCLAGGCGHWNVPAADWDLIDMIGPWHKGISEACPGVVCAKCRKPVDPRGGRWVHRFPDRRWTQAGYHVPQIIMPMHYASHEKWDALVGKMQGRANTTPTTFLNEVCGESCDQGSKLITVSELRAACVLPWPRRAAAAKAHVKRYVRRVLSVDWGGGGGQVRGSAGKTGEQKRERTSYTTLAVLGMTPDGKVDTLWGHRSVRTHDWEYEARLCLEAVKEFKCSHVVHDYSGAGEGRLVLLYQSGLPPTNIVNVRYQGFGHNIMNFHEATDDHPHDWYSIDKSRSLVTTCMAIKYGLVRFFQYDYVSADQPGLLEDFLALIEEKVDTRLGSDAYVIVRNPNKPDDFAHSVNMGCCALWWMTKKWPNIAEAAKFKIAKGDLKHMHPVGQVDWDDM